MCTVDLERHPPRRRLPPTAEVNYRRPFGDRARASLLAFAALLGAYHARLASAGERIDIGGFRLQLDCLGHGQAIVILDAGIGGSASDWRYVQQGLASAARVCTYDRAGYGGSDPGPPPRTSSRLASELRSLLARAPLAGPYIVVGHSFGGYNVRLFASMFPDDTRGIVLVDAPHEGQADGLFKSELVRHLDPRGELSAFWNSPALSALSSIDLRPFAGILGVDGKTLGAILGELSAFEESSAEVLSSEIPTQVPLVVVMHGRRVLPAGPLGDQMEEQWLSLQRDLAERHPKGRFIIARDSAHNIPAEQPDLLIDAIRTLIEDR